MSGYRCAIVAAGMLRRFFPLNMTAAGTVQPAEVVVLGAGVAGLQAIATAKRLGAVVRAYDVRAAAAEEIRSMGAKAIELELETLEGSGGYAREMTEDRAARQMELLDAVHRRRGRADHHRRGARSAGAAAGHPRDGRADEARLGRGRPGSGERRQRRGLGCRRGGPDRQRAGVGRLNVPAQMPGPASKLYAQNIVNIVTLMTVKPEEEGGAATFTPDFDDEIVVGACVTHGGEIRHEPTREAIEGPAPAPPRDQPTDQPTRSGGGPVSNDIIWLTFFVLSVFVGIEVISKVSSTLHTPLMSGANAIHGIILLGAILVAGEADGGIALTVALIAVVLAAVNMVGGFLVTDRMLQFFVQKKKKPAPDTSGKEASS